MKDVTACWPTPFPPKKKQDASSVFANPTFFLKHWNQQDSLKRISPETHRKNGHFENVQAFLGQKGRNLSGVGATFIFQVRLMCFFAGPGGKEFPPPAAYPLPHKEEDLSQWFWLPKTCPT